MARLQAKDGEYKKQDLVSRAVAAVKMDAFRAMLFAPEKLNAKANAMPGVLAQARDDIVEEQYIVTVRRIQGTWEYTIHHDGAEIEMDAFRAMLFAPEKLNAKANAMPGVLAQARDDIVEEQYIVTVRRIQGTWEYTIHHDGAEIKLPSEVIDRINKSRDLIISRGRKDAARKRLQRVAAGDQAAAAREPDNAAGAMSFLGVDDDDDLD